MKQRFLLFIFITCALAINAQVKNGVYNILDYGVLSDSSKIATPAINNAIENAFKNGGGKVIIPSGRYRSGTIFLKDNVELHLMEGALLEASDDYNDFPIIPPANYRSLKEAGGWSALIYAEGAENISITGKGVIDGKGKSRKGRVSGVAGDCNGRPRNILFISCKNVSVCGVRMFNSATWNQHYLDCEDVTVSDITVFNHCNGNNDGIDIDGCRRFILSNSIIDADDDGIVLKSTGLSPCEDVIISNCIVSSFANAIKCGTESTGGFKNILVSDCVVKPSRSKGERVIKSTPSGITGISLEIVDGGIMDGVSINNILIEGTECPLYVRLANRGRKHHDSASTPPVGEMRNISVSNVTAYGTGNFCSSITGIPERKIENLYLNNIRFINKGGLSKGNFLTKEILGTVRHDMAKNMFPDKYWVSYRDVVEDEKGYPQPTVWRNLPSYGLFIRHVKDIEVNNGTFTPQNSDPRIPIIAVNVDNLSLNRIITKKGSQQCDVLLHKVLNVQSDSALTVHSE